MNSKSQKSPQPVKFVAPFDDNDADLIIRSSDGAHFAVFKVILRKASPVFADMFTLPQTGPGGSPPVVDLTEDRVTIRALLQLCYPASPPGIHTLETLSTLMNVCDKYGMDGPKGVLERCYPRQFLTESPLLVYAIASRARCTTMTMEAARHCLHEPAIYMITTSLSIFPPTSVASYQQVLNYHLACRTIASTVVSKYISVYAMPDSTFAGQLPCWHRCNRCAKNDRRTIMRLGEAVHVVDACLWWVDLVSSIAGSLENKPKDAAVFDPIKRALEVKPKFHSACTVCKDRSLSDLNDFLPELQKHVEKVIAEVPFEPVF